MPRIGHRPMYGLMPMLGAKQIAGAPYTANSSLFTASSSQYLTLAESMENSNKFTLSFWIRRTTTGTEYVFSGGESASQKVFVWFLSGGALRVRIIDTGNTEITQMTSVTTIGADSTWHHIFVVIDNSVNGSEVGLIYIDGNDDSATNTGWATNNPIWFVGPVGTPTTVYCSTMAGGSYLDACLADVWMSTEYVDPTSYISNFISGGKPVNLGADGSTASPTSTQPEIFLSNPAATFKNNLGTLSNFTESGGAPAACASGPSD